MKKYILSAGLFFLLVNTYAQNKVLPKPIVGSGMEVDPYFYTIAKTATFGKCAVASAHQLASLTGAAVMRRGGNAFDAAIAVQLALAVVYPGAGNIGGGGFMTARKADGKLVTLDFREKAPVKASRDMYLDALGNASTDLSQNGVLSVGVPGTVAGIFKILPYAKLSLETLITPAIDLAERGFVLTQRSADDYNHSRADFIKYNSYPVAFIKKDSSEWHAGDTLFQKDLANTLRRIRDKGAAGFYEGKTAKLLIATVQGQHGIISAADLKNYAAVERKPLSFDYRGYNIISFPPPSSGGLILAQVLKMIEPFPVGDLGFQTPQSVHLLVEAERRAYADRAQYMGDPDFWKVPDSALLSADYLRKRFSDYQDEKATPSTQVGPGNIKESEETTHISIADEEGNVVSITTTLNNHFGSRVVVKDAGFILNDEMDDFSIKPGVPNMYGAVGGEANAIAPGKRMLSSMAPTLVLQNGQPVYVVGSPGGTTIPTSVVQSLVNVIDFKMNIDAAVNAPKFHHQWLPDSVLVEPSFPVELRERLETFGHKVIQRSSIGRVEMIERENGKYTVVADGRGEDGVAGF